MTTTVHEFVGIGVTGYDGDWIEVVDGAQLSLQPITMQELFPTELGDDVPSAFARVGEEAAIEASGESLKWWHRARERVAAYRKESGRQYPPLYRAKITVEYEALPDAESDAWWRAFGERHRVAVEKDAEGKP